MPQYRVWRITVAAVDAACGLHMRWLTAAFAVAFARVQRGGLVGSREGSTSTLTACTIYNITVNAAEYVVSGRALPHEAVAAGAACRHIVRLGALCGCKLLR